MVLVHIWKSKHFVSTSYPHKKQNSGSKKINLTYKAYYGLKKVLQSEKKWQENKN